MSNKDSSAAGGWLISAGAVGKDVAGLRIGAAPQRTPGYWQMHGAAGSAPHTLQSRQVWYSVLATLVGDD